MIVPNLRKMKKLPIVFFFSLSILLVSCGPNYIFDQSQKIDQAEWTYQDSLSFNTAITDSLKIYNLYLGLEHATTFSMQNLYVKIHTTFPSGQRLSELVSLELANKAGVWFGDCNSEWCDLSIPIQTGAYFDLPGNYTFTIEQYTRKEPLQGVKNISFKIEDTGVSRGQGVK